MVAQFSFWGNHIPRVFPLHLRGTGESFAANIGGRVIGTDLENPDFVKLADAFGALGLRAHNADELKTAIQQGFDADRPTLIDVPVGEMPAPWALYFLPKNRGK